MNIVGVDGPVLVSGTCKGDPAKTGSVTMISKKITRVVLMNRLLDPFLYSPMYKFYNKPQKSTMMNYTLLNE